MSEKYAAPPISEVVLAVYFERLDLKSVHMGLLWERLRTGFTRYEDAPPLPPIAPLGEDGPQIILGSPSAVPRVLFQDETTEYIAQVQSDRFCLNWRRAMPDHSYPGLDVLSGRFFATYGEFCATVLDRKIGEVRPTILELTYVNLINAEEHRWFTPSPFTFLEKPKAASLERSPVRHTLNMGIAIADDERRTQLEISTFSSIPDPFFNRKAIAFQLMSRSSVEGNTIDEIKSETQRCRQLIREVFESSIPQEKKISWS